LGIEVTDDRMGCLQDVHWAHGSFGYFPTYSLGSFYAAQFFTTATGAVPFMEVELRNGNTGLLMDWLAVNIYQYGRTLTSEELCREVSGKPLDIQYFLDYILAKYQNIYNF
jgi:carboxypeptidase Taq